MREDYPLFVQWYTTLDWILSTVENYPKKVRFSVASRISGLALDIMECVIEAIYAKQRVHILEKVNLYMEKLRVLFRLSHDRKYISVKQYQHISEAIDEAGRMAGGWLRRSRETGRKSV